jgi:hypothetical protein
VELHTKSATTKSVENLLIRFAYFRILFNTFANR